MNISELTDQYNTNEEKINKKKLSIKRLQGQLKKMENNNSWIDVILRPIAQEISNSLGLPVWDILGPFGLESHTSIHLAKDEETLKDCSQIKSITFVPEHEGIFKLYVKDLTIDIKHGMSGPKSLDAMNYPNVDITDLSIEELIKKWVA